MQKTCIHAYGNNQVVSPNIDRIIDQGISFTHTYTNGSLGGALSMPSRAMIMTGRGVYEISGDGADIPEQQVTLPELLWANGYETFATGKWHADPLSFNRSFAKAENIFFGGMHPYETNGHVSPHLNHYDPEGNDHSVCVPMAMVIPGMEKGTRKDVDCYLSDIYPTLCDLLNIKPAASVTSKSLAPVLYGAAKHRDQLFLAYSSFQRALVKDGWKYIIYNVDGVITEQLFNLQTDPDEMVNLAADAKYDFKKQAYKRILKEEMKKNDDFCNLDLHYWMGRPGKMSWDEASKLYVY